MKLAIASMLLLLAGCATMNMSPEQIAAMANTSSSLCFTGAGWNGAPTTLSYSSFGGKSTGSGGGGGTAKCGGSEVTYTNDGRAPAAVKP